MNRWAQSLLGVLFVFLVVEVMLISPRDVEKVGEPEITIHNESSSGPEVEQAMTGIRVTGSRDENKEWQLWADQAFDYRQEERWNLKKVRAVFFGQGGASFEVVGDQGFVDLLSKDMRIEGSVVTTSSNGYVFRTDEMTYKSVDKELTSNSKVFMTGPKDKKNRHMSLSGDAVWAKLKDSMIEVRGDVRAHKPLEKNKNLVLTSNTALFSGQSNLAKFHGNVRMEMDGMKISGPEVVFNYDRERGEVVAVDVLGGVRVSDLDKWATAQRLNVQLDSRKIVFTGSPRVVQNDDELRGEEIVFHNGGEQVEVRRARARVERKTLERM